jgi:hypothetical protein
MGDLSDVEYDVAKAANIEIFKEFSGTDTSYISFKPSVPVGSVLGAIVHSISGDQAYAAPLLAQVFDNSHPDKSYSEFLANDTVEINILSFIPKTHSTVNIDFARSGTTFKEALGNDLQIGHAVTGGNLDMAPFIFDLTNQSPLDVTVLTASSESNSVSEHFSITIAELSTVKVSKSIVNQIILILSLELIDHNQMLFSNSQIRCQRTNVELFVVFMKQ